ncbi:hypothetical protein ACOSP7_023307 [Xanthoceras sorbifolium]
MLANYQALLAKQCWRIIQNPSSLCARVLKGRYFPNSSFLQASVGRGASHMWRSFLWGRNIINMGTYWRIGDGRDVQVFHDRWIPHPSSFRIFFAYVA